MGAYPPVIYIMHPPHILTSILHTLPGFVVRSRPAEDGGDDVVGSEQQAEESVGEAGGDGDEGPRDEPVASIGSNADQGAQAGVRVMDVAMDGPGGEDDDATQHQDVCEVCHD